MKVFTASYCVMILLFAGCSKGDLAKPFESTCFDDQGGKFRARAHMNGEAWLAEFAEYFFVEEDKVWIRLYKATPEHRNSSLEFTFTDLDVNRRDTIKLIVRTPSQVSMSEIVGCDAVDGSDYLFSPGSFENWLLIEEVTEDKLIAKFQIALKGDGNNTFTRPEESFFTNGRIVAKWRER